ncbi:TetR/AcrR family transcriptional regulator [Virgisporangium ochraceum]|uniref:TetR/AcrR family transcriptional regulator n=1 Tax=Virgisporangium ochraceum TaxID=65505 RepID=UPI0019408D8D|nr:TetR/AcrR family transcriptional regulator [Virgisporangium ochraceum]
MTRSLRSDAERSVRSILEAAERVLADNPAASLEQVAEAAGVARTTVHRRFANRQALVDALAVTAARHLREAVDAAHPDTAPPLVALHQITANVIRTKGSWQFALAAADLPGSAAEADQRDLARRCVELFGRARDQGVLPPDADLEWTRRVYYALIGETVHGTPESADPDTLAARVVHTLLNGVGRAS